MESPPAITQKLTRKKPGFHDVGLRRLAKNRESGPDFPISRKISANLGVQEDLEVGFVTKSTPRRDGNKMERKIAR